MLFLKQLVLNPKNHHSWEAAYLRIFFSTQSLDPAPLHWPFSSGHRFSSLSLTFPVLLLLDKLLSWTSHAEHCIQFGLFEAEPGPNDQILRTVWTLRLSKYKSFFLLPLITSSPVLVLPCLCGLLSFSFFKSLMFFFSVWPHSHLSPQRLLDSI